MISVIIPAHNEVSVIARALTAMTAGAEEHDFDIIVVCNGCTDDTASVARQFTPFVRVIETDVASKTQALNLGDQAALGFPRIYADADVVITPDTIRSLAQRLEGGDVLAVAPTANVDLCHCSWAVRAYYDVRSHLPSAQEGIGGSGVYAMSAAGRSRFLEFPSLTADDGYVRIQFTEEERVTLHSVFSTVFPPRRIKQLITTKTRSHYGSFELAARFPERWKQRGEGNFNPLIRLFAYPQLWAKLAIYCVVTVIAKRRAQKRFRLGAAGWERDKTSRVSV
jgi:glycosyltransferase involved in cell wall biosynthesis